MRKAALTTCCILILYGAGIGFSQVSEIGFSGGFVPDFSNAQVVSRNTDGSVTFDNGATLYPDGSIVREIGGRKFLRTMDGKVTDITPATSVIMRKDPVTGIEHYYRVGPDNKAVEIK